MRHVSPLYFVLFLALGACNPDPAAGDDAGPTTDGGTDGAAMLGPPIDAPDHVWTWIPFPESRCMNGTPTGIGVNLSKGSRRVLIVLEGGGACFDGLTCTVGTIHQDGFNQTTFNLIAGTIGKTGVLDRNNSDNPFAGWSYVFVPYCTGDIHAGDKPDGTGGRMFVGYANIGHYLKRLVPTFANAEMVVLTGSSAGGFGAAWNFDRVQRAFGGVPVHLLDDSGPVLPDMYLKPCLQKRFRDQWNLNATLPPDCAECKAGDGGFINLPLFYAKKYPDRRGGIISGEWDAIIRAFMSPGYSNDCKSAAYFPPGDYSDGLHALRKQLAGKPNFHVFYIPSEKHTWLMDQPLGFGATTSGVKLTDWLRAFISGGQDFRDVYFAF